MCLSVCLDFSLNSDFISHLFMILQIKNYCFFSPIFNSNILCFCVEIFALFLQDLYPALCIHYGGSEADRLPTASTCMNLLKLPECKDFATLKHKLLYAVESGAGFELS